MNLINTKLLLLMTIIYELLLLLPTYVAFNYKNNKNQNENNFHYTSVDMQRNFFNLGKKSSVANNAASSSSVEPLIASGTSQITTIHNTPQYYFDNNDSNSNGNSRKNFTTINYGNYNGYPNENSNYNLNDAENDNKINQYTINSNEDNINDHDDDADADINNNDNGFKPITTTELPKSMKKILSSQDFLNLQLQNNLNNFHNYYDSNRQLIEQQQQQHQAQQQQYYSSSEKSKNYESSQFNQNNHNVNYQSSDFDYSKNQQPLYQNGQYQNEPLGNNYLKNQTYYGSFNLYSPTATSNSQTESNQDNFINNIQLTSRNVPQCSSNEYQDKSNQLNNPSTLTYGDFNNVMMQQCKTPTKELLYNPNQNNILNPTAIKYENMISKREGMQEQQQPYLLNNFLSNNYQQKLNENSDTNYYQPKEISIGSASIPNSIQTQSPYNIFSNEIIHQTNDYQTAQQQSLSSTGLPSKVSYYQPYPTVINPIIHHPSSQFLSSGNLQTQKSLGSESIKGDDIINEIGSTHIGATGLDDSSTSSITSNNLYPTTISNLQNQGQILAKHIDIIRTKHIPVPIYKQIHVPYKRPVKIQIPQPIIMTIPKPTPIQIPITKTVTVPIQQEIKIPVEKLIPLMIEKRIPYKIEKHIPYPVEKQITIPIYKPFPVRVPVIKTVLHKASKIYHPHHSQHPHHILPSTSSLISSSSPSLNYHHQYPSNYGGWNYK